MLGGTASASTPRSHATSSTDAGTGSERGLTGWKAAIHKIDVGTRAHHEKTALGPVPATLPSSADVPGDDARADETGGSTAAPLTVVPGGVLGRAPPR